MKKFNFQNPYVVMCIPLIMYLIEFPSKLIIGSMINSPTFTGDGYHNASDLVQVLFIMGGVFLSRLPPSAKYKLGLMSIESVLSAIVGASLGFLAVKTFVTSFWILLSHVLGSTEPYPLEMSTSNGLWAGGVALVCGIVSLVVGAIEVNVGKKLGHQSMVSDGLETRSDAIIGFSILVGVIGQYLFNAPWLEYVFAMGVAILMAKTAWGISKEGWAGLLHKTIGVEHDRNIVSIAKSLPGVVDVPEIITFRVGSKVVVTMKVTSRASQEACMLLKQAIAFKIVAYLKENEFTDGTFKIRFEYPSTEVHRMAVFLKMFGGGPTRISNSWTDWSHILVCDIKDGEVSRATLSPNSDVRNLRSFILNHHIEDCVLFDPSRSESPESAQLEGIAKLCRVSSADPTYIGFKL